jgi:TusA-related sulfurtransferase
MTKSSHSPLPPTSSSPGDATEGATSSITSSATSSIDPRAATREGSNGPAPPDPSGQDIPLLNLCGELCPFTFVRTKLALEELPIGAQLRVIVDHEPATRNIPRSAAEWGQEVIAVIGLSPRTWAIDLRKRVR